jgi:hypothetical protein
MTGDREEWIRELMGKFREAAQHPEMERYAGYYSFPRGSCTWASYAFGHLLAEREPDADWHIVNASGPSALQGHDWLEGGGLGVDVTADQFPGHEPYVGELPVPLPPEYKPKQRIELGEWHPPHADALQTLRALMSSAGQE